MPPSEMRTSDRLIAALNYVFLLAAAGTIAAILAAALALQLGKGELPCPLCLLERAAMFGAAFAMLQNLRHEYSSRNTGILLGFALFLLVVAVRQTLLDIYPRPGHAYIGSAVLGLHMPVWSVLIAVALIAAVALKLALLGGDSHMRGARPSSFPLLGRLAPFLALVLIGLALANFVLVVVQCGLGECHTEGYALLGNSLP
ncbi:disulfide bond formation protein B [uncultured Amaricoccus sp.]|uniref:disulfide bond formation protein B n=1 Tax=uncultured Amaricoccus sp. TaxID=339341 RepID=UPI002629D7E0|nr:disulfide bond formation protein B [uncultured Amaricoccus sp.]